jgi:anti-anti-sigma regulatory factor
MTCKFERVVTADGFVVLHISGRIDSADVEILRELIENDERAKSILAIDLTEVTLIGRDAIRLLSTVETKGTELRNCPAYIRNWVSRDKCPETETD